MLTEGHVAARMADLWTLDWVSRTGMFGALHGISRGLPQIGWPNVELLNDMADGCGQRIVNARGQRIQFVEQISRPAHFEDGFEPRTFLEGEVMVRPLNWHDLFNALSWMTYPTSKAVINARHYAELTSRSGSDRTATGDALTLFDEDGLVVLSSDPELLDLLREFRWKELFWTRRDEVRHNVRFLIFGHAMAEKALDPFVGMTGKALLFRVPDETIRLQGSDLNKVADQLVAGRINDPENLTHGRALAPLPVLGVPGWWPENENAIFYDDTTYFRPGRARTQNQLSVPSSNW